MAVQMYRGIYRTIYCGYFKLLVRGMIDFLTYPVTINVIIYLLIAMDKHVTT